MEKLGIILFYFLSVGVCISQDSLQQHSLSVNDSLELYPAYDLYCGWDTIGIHPYHFDPSTFLDTTVIPLTGTFSCEYCQPRKGKVNSNFGTRGRRRKTAHFGIDIDLEKGDTVVAAFDGMVRIAVKNKSYGNVVIMRHRNGLETYYAHLSKLLVRSNQWVNAGDVIGLGGNTGHSFGAHLHFEIRYKGLPMNPNDVIDFANERLIADTIVLTPNNFEYFDKVASGKVRVSNVKKKTKAKSYFPSETTSANTVADNTTTSSSDPIKPKGKKSKYYYVKKGDTLYSIAHKNGTTVKKLCKLNGIKENTTLAIGRKIKCS